MGSPGISYRNAAVLSSGGWTNSAPAAKGVYRVKAAIEGEGVESRLADPLCPPSKREARGHADPAESSY
jgi:hypothetical protein